MRRGFSIGALAAACAARLAFAQPDPAALRKLYEDALTRRLQTYGERDARSAQAARDLGLFLARSSDKAAARRALANALRLDDQALGPHAAQTLEDAATLAAISPAAQAEPLLRRAAGSPDPIVAGPALTNLAAIRRSAGDLASAAQLLRRALEKAEASEGRDSPTVALVLNLLAQVVGPKEAVPLLQRALAIDQQSFGPANPQTRQDARNLSALLRATGQTAEAAQLERQFQLAPPHESR
jgi:hypothetical protein